MRSFFVAAAIVLFGVGCGAHGDSDVGPAPIDGGVDGSSHDVGADSSSVVDSGAHPSDSGTEGETATPIFDTSTCDAGGACTPSDPCKTGTIDCSSGSPACVASGNAPNGTSCGTNEVCHDGTCNACTTDASCTPSNACHVGKTSCTTGVPLCDDTGANVANGTSCGTSLVCKAGSCVACSAGAACTAPSVCKNGAIDCSSGDPVCADASSKPDGTGCGTHAVCTSGSCGCSSGFTSCGAACVDTQTDAANCGGCGVACESGVCKNGGCETYFGTFETGPAGCERGTCSCPGASAVWFTSPNLVIESAYSPAVTQICMAATHTKPSDFGGAYALKDPAGGCGSVAYCASANPFTGACSCPLGTTPISMRVITDPCSGSGMIGGELAFCWGGSSPLVSFGGAYEVDDPTTGGLGCRIANPATGACTCPGGTSTNPVLRVWVDSSAGIIGSQIYVCSAP